MALCRARAQPTSAPSGLLGPALRSEEGDPRLPGASGRDRSVQPLDTRCPEAALAPERAACFRCAPMGVWLDLVGRTDPASALARLTTALEARGLAATPVQAEDGPALSVPLHPAAEPLVISATRTGVRAAIRTGTAGPGLHAHASELLGALGDELGIAWDPAGDPTGYFATRELARVEDALLAQLGELAREVLVLAGRGAADLALFLPDDVRFEHDGLLATPLGPRDRAWVERVARDPRQGIDVLAWWAPGEDAAYHRGRALAELWTEFRWRPPLDDRERAQHARVLASLERAYALDPELELPWRAWSELLQLTGEDSLRATRTHLRAERAPLAPPIGYRRRPVRVELSGGWSLRVPGTLATEWRERGTWVGWDAVRSVWFTSVTREGDGDDTETTLAGLPELRGEGDTLAMERGPIRGAVRFGAHEEGGRTLSAMWAQAAAGRHAALGTFVLSGEDDRQLAMEIWGSLDRAKD